MIRGLRRRAPSHRVRRPLTITPLTRYLHTMYRITDPERSREFYETLGFEHRRELPIVRDGKLEATNYFFGMPGEEEELELTFNHDGRSYELGRPTGTSRSRSMTSMARSRASRSRGSSPTGSRTGSAREARASLSSPTRIVSFER
jgi:catechol 2,3-dioxygenase-like lactoylglutathione lyase family enzyme